MVATFFSWFLANTNAYKMAQHVDATWIRQGFYRQEPTFFMAMKSLLYSETSTWTRGWNDYDGTQWTLVLFLQGSMMVYITMLISVLTTAKARRVIFATLWLYGWLCYKGRLFSKGKPINPSIKPHNF